MTVVSLADARKERSPHWEGACKCVGCGHEYRAVAEIGVMWVDCPSCGMAKGHPKHPFGAPEGASLFVCNCGSEALTAYFHKGRFRMVCMGCGTDQTTAIYGDAS